jgi:hypothetical protein
MLHLDGNRVYQMRLNIPNLALYFSLRDMPSLEILKKYASRPSSRKWEETRVYVARNGAKAIFSNPIEFHMGAYSWDLELFENGLKHLASKSGLYCPSLYQPWSHDSGCLFLISLKEGAFLYEITTGSARRCDLTGVVCCIGSRRFPLFLAITVKGEYLVGRDGRVTRDFQLRRPLHGLPFLSWFDEAGLFFAVEKQGPGLATLRFFNAETAGLSASQAFNPNSLFPYDEVKYKDLSRDSFSLVLSGSSQCVGSLLDEWSSIDFDENTGVLRMMVYRPLGEIFERRSLRSCEVKESWVEIRLKP